MLFNKNDGKANERILYKTKPNMVLGCKKAIYGIILLAVILFVSPIIIRFIGHMQVYLISQINLSLTRYAALALFVVILIDIVYIIWQLIGWYTKEYTLTDTKIIIKSGVLSTKKNYMPYATIQDVNTSQSILAKLFNVGTVSVFSAYDNNQMELSNISNPSEVEDIIFSRMVSPRGFQPQPPRFPQQDLDYQEPDEYYPEDLGYPERGPRHKYEYEPYDNGYNNSSNCYPRRDHYNRVRDDYYDSDENYYSNNEPESYYDEDTDNYSKNDGDDMSENVIQRHFDKFKR